MRQLQLPVELLQLVFSYVSQHRYLPCSSGLDQRQDQGHEQWRGQDLSNPFAVVAEEEPCKDIKTCATQVYFIPYPGNAVQDLNLSLLTGSQSMISDTFLSSTNTQDDGLFYGDSGGSAIRIQHDSTIKCVVLDLTGRSARLCEFDLCKPPIRKRHNLVTNPDTKVGPIFKNARTIVNITTKANQRERAMDSPDWIVLPSTHLHRLQLKNCRITDESIMAIFPKGVSALADAPTGSLGMFLLIDFNC
ncbi:hypothetical protein BSLG_009135 [Batrachochytrium salamandrivorans]|nr:hypothetical protein BSLG_009135 [Batrachochytrium salamandrivorans]